MGGCRLILEKLFFSIQGGIYTCVRKYLENIKRMHCSDMFCADIGLHVLNIYIQYTKLHALIELIIIINNHILSLYLLYLIELLLMERDIFSMWIIFKNLRWNFTQSFSKSMFYISLKVKRYVRYILGSMS